MYKLKDWTDVNKLNWKWLSSNESPNAIDMLRLHPDKIDWHYLSGISQCNRIVARKF
jgi:hypothetical protein